MDIPMACTLGRGSYTVRPAKTGLGLVTWLCTLRAAYTVRADAARRIAWFNFLLLLRERMAASTTGDDHGLPGGGPPGEDLSPAARFALRAHRALHAVVPVIPGVPGGLFPPGLDPRTLQRQKELLDQVKRPWLIDFGFDEGIYLDSKTTTFTATWRLVCSISHIMLASGLWRKAIEKNDKGENLWAISMRDPRAHAPTGIMGSQSWLRNRPDVTLDAIVDFGSA